jgi:3-hydroxyisobutyrate dehydrogenase-like beta-hydroxyacid dehydrogenase
MIQRIGFVGLGVMGVPMARNLLKAGFAVTVFNRTPGRDAEVREAGAKIAPDLPSLAREAEVVVSMVFGQDGLMPGLAPGKVLVNMSTVPPDFTRSLAARLGSCRVDFVDAPVSGSKKPAQDGTLVVLAGGAEAAVARVEPVLLAMGKKVVRCGPAGAGSSMKLTLNLLLGVMAAGLGEAVNFGAACGLDPSAVMDAVLAGSMACPLFGIKTDMMVQDEFPQQFALKHMLKDLRFVLSTADAAGAAIPAAHAAFQLYRQAAGKGLSEADFAAVKAVIGGMSEGDGR